VTANRGDFESLAIATTSGGARLRLRVKPGARRPGVVGEYAGALRVAVSAPPDKGRANDEVLDVVAEALGVPRGAVRLLAGHASRDKSLEVDGLSADEVRRRLVSRFGGATL